MTHEIAEAVRRHLAAEVARVVGELPNLGAVRGASPHRARARFKGAVLEDLLGVIRTSPGLRSEQIYKMLPQRAPRVLKAGLAKLRGDKKVQTSGQKRSTTYKVA